jgi:FkbM family methyltransferase
MKILVDVPYNDNQKFAIEGDDTDGILRHAKTTNSFSFYLQKLVIDICLLYDSNFTILNAGANLGLVCLPISPFCKKVYAFEPMPHIFEYLKRNIATNNVANIESFNCALSNSNKSLVMEPYGWDKTHRDSGHSVVIDNLYEYDKQQYVPKPETPTLSVETKTIDSYNLDSIDMLLLDTEGYEPYVIDGAKDTIAKHKPYIVVEHEVGHVKCRHMTSRSIIDNIITMGYQKVKIIIKDNHNNKNYALLPLEYDDDNFLTILKSYPCVDLLFIPENKKDIA